MHIDSPQQQLLDATQAKQSLEIFLEQPSHVEMPPCPGCDDHNILKCSESCPDAHTALSSQPVEFPIEANVTPLVFGLMSTQVTQTCWSCEGHMDTNNNLIKLPTVSFYTVSPIYPQLLHRHVMKLKMDKKLNYPWHVVLTDYAQTWAQTYSIAPNLNFFDKDIHLGGLQNDLKVIAANLQKNMKALAKEMIVDLDKWIKKENQHNSV